MEKVKCHYTEEEKKKHEAEFMSNKPAGVLESIDHASGVNVGDMVVVRNAYDIPVGPYKVLGFTKWDEVPRMFLDWDCWWFPAKIDNIVKIY